MTAAAAPSPLAKRRRALRFDGRAVVLVEDDRPPLPAGHLRVRSEWTLVSIGTEIAWIRELAKIGGRTGLGYANVGVIEAVGDAVTGWLPGQRVLTPGPHASVVDLPADEAVAVPEGLDPGCAAMAMLASVACHIVQRAAPRMSEPAAVVGQGVVGALVLQLLRACGAEPLIAIDTDQARLHLARAGGAETIDAASEDVAARVRAITGGAGVALCVEAATSAEAIAGAIAMLALRGRLVLTSTIHQPVPIRVLEDVIERELTLIGAHQPKCPTAPNPYHPWTQRGNRLAAMRAMRDGRLRVEPLISHRVRAEQAPGLYARLVAGDRSIVGMLIDWRD